MKPHVLYRYFPEEDYLMTAGNVALAVDGVYYELTTENATEYIGQYPLGGWYYFATPEEAEAFFRPTPVEPEPTPEEPVATEEV